MAGLLVIGWHVMAARHHSITGQDWRKMAAELGSVPQFRRERWILANHAHNCVVYNQDVEKNVGFFFCNIPAGKKIFLCEGLQTDWFGWSPDDSLFIYRTSVETNSTQLKFVICDGKTAKTLNELRADNSGRVAWLSSRAFVYEANSTLVVIEKTPDGNWIRKSLLGYSRNATHLTGITATSVAWQEQNDSESVIREIDVNSGSITTIWESATNQLFEFTYSNEDGEFLLNCIDAEGQYVIRYYPAIRRIADGGRIVKGKDEWISNVTLDQDSIRYAYLNENGLGSFDLKANSGSEVLTLPWHGGVTQYALFGHDLFVTGNPENESPGMWHYNLATKILNCVALEATNQYQYAKRVPSLCGVTTNSLGDETGYFLWPPARVMPGKKYPLIITQTVNEWLPYQEAAADAGYYFAIARRSTFHNKRQDKWDEDVMALYETLVQNPGLNIDTNQMYLWGRCAETGYISNLLNTNPNLWKGLIMFDPSILPDFEKLRNKSVFLITGRDADNAQELLRYQTDGFSQGVPIKLILQDHIGHLSMSVATERARTIWFTEFLLQSK